MIELLAACGAWVFVNVLALHRMFEVLNRKPFACETCMAGWFTLILAFGDYWLYMPFRMAVSMIIAIFLTALIRKF